MKKSIFISLFLVVIFLFNTSVSFGVTYKPNSIVSEDWYEIENQPDEALNIVELWIGKKTYTVNGISKESDVAPVIRSSRTLVPIRVISEGLGAVVDWDGTERKVTIHLETLDGNKTVELFIGKKNYYIDGIMYEMDVPPQIINNRTMVPIRVVSESLNCKVYWDGTERKVTVKAINLQSDADFDSLTFEQEYSYGTDPNNPDTDNDGLTDEQEYQYKTNPNNPDTDGDGLSDGTEIKYHLNPLKDYSNPFSIIIRDKDYAPLSGMIEKISGNNEAFSLFKNNITAINNIQDENNRLSVLTKFLNIINSVLNDKAALKSLEEDIEKYGATNIDKVEAVLNKQKKAEELINSFYKNKDEKLKENFLQFLYPKLNEENPENIDGEVNSFFSFVSSLPDELKTYELNTFLFFEDGKLDDTEKAFINAYLKNKDDKGNIALAKKVIDSYLDKIPQDDPNRDKFINEIKALPEYTNIDTESALSSVESFEDIVSLYLEGKPYKNFENRFNNNESTSNNSIVIDGKIDDWKSLGLKPVIQDPENDESAFKENCDITDVYAMIQNGYLYIALETTKPIDRDASFIFPIDTNGDGDWDYSIGFNKNSAWFYNLKDYPNGKWPDKSMDITSMSRFEIADAAEIKVYLSGFLTNTTRIKAWINAKVNSQWKTIDETDMSDNIPVISVNNSSAKTELEEKKKHDVWEAFDLMLRGGNPSESEENILKKMKKYTGKIRIDGEGDDWKGYPFLVDDPTNDLNVEPPQGVSKDSVDIVKYGMARDENYIYVVFMAKGKPSKDRNVGWRCRFKTDRGYYEIDSDNNVNVIYLNRYGEGVRGGTIQILKVGHCAIKDVVELKIPISKLWNFRSAKVIQFEAWSRNLISKKDIDDASPFVESCFTYKIPDYNAELYLLNYLAENTEFKPLDTLAESDAISNGLFIAIGDDEVKKTSSEDSLELLQYFRDVNEWQKKTGIFPLENLPLLEKMFLTSFMNESVFHDSKKPGKLSFREFMTRTMSIENYKWVTPEISTLKEMKDFVEKTILPKSGSNTDNIANTTDDYFFGSGFRKHWIFPLKYNKEKDILERDFPDINIDGINIFPRDFNNTDFEWKFFKENGKGIGDCGDESSLVLTILKSVGISSWNVRYVLEYKFREETHFCSHRHIIYYSPIKRKWFAPKLQLYIDMQEEQKPNPFFLIYDSDVPTYNIYEFIKHNSSLWPNCYLTYNIKTLNLFKKTFYNDGFPESEMKKFIYQKLYSTAYP